MVWFSTVPVMGEKDVGAQDEMWTNGTTVENELH